MNPCPCSVGCIPHGEMRPNPSHQFPFPCLFSWRSHLYGERIQPSLALGNKKMQQ
jgi:hypothetical protein